ncbi:hypothetical protein [Sphingomonas sp.]
MRWPIARKLIAGSDDEGEDHVEEPSLFPSALIRRSSVAAPSE